MSKKRLLQADDLRMGEVVTFERKSGWTINELANLDENATPMGVVMALAYLTEKRRDRSVKWSKFQGMTFAQFNDYLEANFEFETPDQPDEDDEGGGSEDPT